jgi:hypothetical protein
MQFEKPKPLLLLYKRVYEILKKPTSFNAVREMRDISWEVIHLSYEWRQHRIWKKHNLNICEILGSHVYDYEVYCFRGYDAVKFGRISASFIETTEPNMIRVEKAVYSFTLIMEAAGSSETS